MNGCNILLIRVKAILLFSKNIAIILLLYYKIKVLNQEEDNCQCTKADMGKNHIILFMKRIRKDIRQKICGREK